jgi:hypothetical protein
VHLYSQKSNEPASPHKEKRKEKTNKQNALRSQTENSKKQKKKKKKKKNSKKKILTKKKQLAQTHRHPHRKNFS